MSRAVFNLAGAIARRSATQESLARLGVKFSPHSSLNVLAGNRALAPIGHDLDAQDLGYTIASSGTIKGDQQYVGLDGAFCGYVPYDTPESAQLKQKAATNAADALSKTTTPDMRADLILKLLKAAHAKKDDLAVVLSHDTGKNIEESKAAIDNLFERTRSKQASDEEKAPSNLPLEPPLTIIPSLTENFIKGLPTVTTMQGELFPLAVQSMFRQFVDNIPAPNTKMQQASRNALQIIIEGGYGNKPARL